jgi:predicted Zn-dependent protease
MRRLAQRPATTLLVALLIVGGGVYGCRTAMGLLSGSLTQEDVERDMAGMRNLSRAMSKANEAITPEDEYYLGRAVAANVLAHYRYQYLEYGQFNRGQISPGLTRYLYHITKILVMAAESRPAKGDRPTPLAGYHVVVVNSPEVNALSAPGGYMFITTGLLRLARNEDEVAAIIAHEMSHIIRGHGIEAIRKARWNRVKNIFFSEAASGVFGDQAAATEFLSEAVADILQRMLMEGYAQKTEYEADAFAMRLLSISGYNPWALYNVIRAMKQHGHGHRRGFYKTHPSPVDRMKALYEVTPKTKYPTPPPARLARFRVAMGHLPPPG